MELLSKSKILPLLVNILLIEQISWYYSSYEVILVQLRNEEDDYISQNTPEGVLSNIANRDNGSTIQQSTHVAFVALKIDEKQIELVRDAHSPESDYSCRTDSQKSFREFLSSGAIEQGKYYTAFVVAYVRTVIDGVKQVEQNRYFIAF